MEHDHRQGDHHARGNSDQDPLYPCIRPAGDQANVRHERDREREHRRYPEHAQSEGNPGVLRHVGCDVPNTHGHSRGGRHAGREALSRQLAQPLAGHGTQAACGLLNEEQRGGEGDQNPDEIIPVTRARRKCGQDAGGIDVGDHDQPGGATAPSPRRPEVPCERGKRQVPGRGRGFA